MDDFQTRVFTVEKAAEHLTLSRATMFKLLKSGAIRSTKIGERTVIMGAELLRFLGQSQRPSIADIRQRAYGRFNTATARR